jgi:hypothetical protein
MDFKSTIDLIIKDLNEASEIIDDLKKYPGVPALQVELAKSKCRSAGEVIALLKSLSYSEPVNKEPDYENQPSQQQDNHEIHIKQEPVIVQAEEKKKVTKPEGSSSSSAGKNTIARGATDKTAEPGMVADKFSPVSDLYSEQTIGIKTEKDLSDLLMIKPIKSLSEAIGLSDKFLFIGEIFKGDKEAYAQAISRLDEAENIDDAMAIIMSYAGEKSESEAVIQLIDLVKKKLPKNE